MPSRSPLEVKWASVPHGMNEMLDGMQGAACSGHGFECVFFQYSCLAVVMAAGEPQRIPTRPSTTIGHQIGKSAGEFPFVVACGIMKHRGCVKRCHRVIPPRKDGKRLRARGQFFAT